MRVWGTALGFGVMAVISGCYPPSDCVEAWSEVELLEHPSSASLHAVTPLPTSGQTFEYMAVGDDGTVVSWGQYVRDATVEPGVTLRGVVPSFGNVWIVGDGGFAAFSDDQGQTWTTKDLDTTADFHAITEVGGYLVIVGDEVVRVIGGAGTWSEVLPPSPGWGQLRAVSGTSEGSTVAVGLGGVIRATDDVTKFWHVEDSGVDVDLLAIGGPYEVFGADGTRLLRDGEVWVEDERETSSDIIAHSRGTSLTATGEVIGFEIGDLDPFVGARALYRKDYELVVVGDGGAIATTRFMSCEEY